MGNVILLQDIMGQDARASIDAFCSSRKGVEHIGEIAGFLKEKFGQDIVLDPDIVRGFMADSSNLPGSAAAVCRPADERECALILRACYSAGIPATISAGRSNLTGSATPEGGIIISMVNFTGSGLEIDRKAKTVNAPVGMILEDLRKQVLSETGGSLYFPVDPTSRADAAVGGCVACNASGFTPGERGAIRQWVESVDFLFPSGFKAKVSRGESVSENGVFVLRYEDDDVILPVPRYRRPAIKNAGGPFSAPDGVMDFVDFVVGSEGVFGLVAGCVLKLADCPRAYLDLFFSLPSEKDAVRFRDYLASVLDGGVGSLSALEYFGANSRKYMNHENVLFHGEDPVAVYIQAPVHEGSVEDAAERWLEIILESGVEVDENAIMILDNDRDRDTFMEARHSMPANSLEVVQHRGTFTIMTDTVVPPDRFMEFLDYTHELIRDESLDYLAFGHLGDCHLHFTVLPEKEQIEKGVGVYNSIVAKSAALGGVYSGEHGTGKRKKGDFLACYGVEGVSDVRLAKQAVDPEFLLNRGNVV